MNKGEQTAREATVVGEPKLGVYLTLYKLIRVIVTVYIRVIVTEYNLYGTFDCTVHTVQHRSDDDVTIDVHDIGKWYTVTGGVLIISISII